MKTNEIDAASSPVPSVDVGGDGNRLPQPTASGAASELLSTLDAVAKGQMLEGFRQKLGRVVAGIIWDEHWNDLDEHAKGDAMRAAEGVLLTFYDAALTASPASDDPKALDAAARSSSTAPEDKVARIMANPCAQKLAPGEPFFILLGRDRNAAEAVAAWSAARRRDRGSSQKTEEADALVAAMDAYRGDGAARSSSTEAVEQEVERLREALKTAECALADIGDADREEGDDVAWCEARAAEALPTVRAALAPSLPGKEEGRG